MKLCKLNASDCAAFWGGPTAPTTQARNAIIIGQAPDCSSFLILTTETEPYLVETQDLDAYVFVYCQAWGLRITPDVVRRAWADARAKLYPPIGDQLDAMWKGGVSAAAVKALVDGVKAKYPKL